MGKNLLNKVWDLHKVATLPSGQDQLFIGLHLVHEVTSPQAFQMLRERGLKVMHPERTFATVDHIVPTDSARRPFGDEMAEAMMRELEKNTREFGIRFFGLDTEDQGIVHVIGPELGLSQPGMIIACGDSHTSTHGALGALGIGVGTTQIRDILATQTLAMSRVKVRKIAHHRQAAARGELQGHHPQDHRRARRQRRARLRLRVRRPDHRGAAHGGAADHLQHEHRRRRPRRLHRARPDDLRLPQGAAASRPRARSSTAP